MGISPNPSKIPKVTISPSIFPPGTSNYAPEYNTEPEGDDIIGEDEAAEILGAMLGMTPPPKKKRKTNARQVRFCIYKTSLIQICGLFGVKLAYFPDILGILQPSDDFSRLRFPGLRHKRTTTNLTLCRDIYMSLI